MKNNKIDKLIRADVEFIETLHKIKLERVRRGNDNILRSDRRLTEGIRRHHLFVQIAEDLINLPLPERNPYLKKPRGRR